MTDSTKKFFIYARKSTDDRDKQVRSIEDQVAELREYALRNDIEIVKVLKEKQSAKQTGRKIFNSMLLSIEKGEANGILSWNPDRLARNLIDGARIVELVEKYNTQLHFPTYTFENTPHGIFCLSLAFGQSKLYIDNLSQNVKRGMRQKAKTGTYPNKAPTGYLNDRKVIVLDPERAPLIQEVFRKYSTGNYTFKELAFTTRYGKKLSPQNIKSILQNPFYYGAFRYENELYEGRHEPLITKKLFEKCQEIMEQRGREQRKHEPTTHPYRQMLVCSNCGCSITSSIQKGHTYYHCTRKKGNCGSKYVRQEIIDNETSKALQKVSIPPIIAEKIEKKLYNLHQQEQKLGANRTHTLQSEIMNCKSKLSTLLDMYIAKEITREEYISKKEDILNEKIKLKERINECDSNEWLEPALNIIKQAKSIQKIALSNNLNEKRNLFVEVGLNRKLNKFSVQYEPAEAWRVLVNKGVSGSEHRIASDSERTNNSVLLISGSTRT